MKGIAVGTLTFLPATFVSVRDLALETPSLIKLWSPSSAPLFSTINQPKAVAKSLSLCPTGSGCIGRLQLHYQSSCFPFGCFGRKDSSGDITNIPFTNVPVLSEQERDIGYGQEESHQWDCGLVGLMVQAVFHWMRYPHMRQENTCPRKPFIGVHCTTCWLLIRIHLIQSHSCFVTTFLKFLHTSTIILSSDPTYTKHTHPNPYHLIRFHGRRHHKHQEGPRQVVQ